MEENYEIILKSYIAKKKMNENLIKNKKVRNPGIDFIRIIAMYGIVINHIMYKKKTLEKYKKFKELKFLHI